jgi:C1A family cysteine protease
LRDGYKSIVKTGACVEELWPYDVTKFKIRPRRRCYDSARQRRVVSYARLHRNIDHLRSCLALKQPFTVGISVHESFEGADVRRSGRLALPKRGEKLLGGHAVVVVGFHDESQRFIVRNSWGKKWGLEGYFTMPYEYLLHEALAWDFWTVKTVS